MAGVGTFLSAEEREKLLKDLADDKEVQQFAATSDKVATRTKPRNRGGNSAHNSENAAADTGCLVCGRDNDHAKLLLCEACNGEYHIYCLKPALKSIPKGDWFCDSCKPEEGDGLDRLVDALPPKFSSRFGEICWAQGGVGYGFWPSCIFDPRKTLGAARAEARKHLGKRHLVFFLKCPEAPFAIVPDHKIASWEQGMSHDLYLGGAAKAFSKQRFEAFQQALQAAMLEIEKPAPLRMSTENLGQLSPPMPSTPEATVEKKNDKKRRRPDPAAKPEAKAAPGAPSSDKQQQQLPEGKKRPRRSNEGEPIPKTSKTHPPSNQVPVETQDDSVLICKIFRKTSTDVKDTESVDLGGFLVLPSMKKTTFAEVRKAITDELVPELLSAETEWRFFVPKLGRVSREQEVKFGAILPFLHKVAPKETIGDGTPDNALKVLIVEKL